MKMRTGNGDRFCFFSRVGEKVLSRPLFTVRSAIFDYGALPSRCFVHVVKPTVRWFTSEHFCIVSSVSGCKACDN
eukprot:g75751.t1